MMLSQTAKIVCVKNIIEWHQSWRLGYVIGKFLMNSVFSQFYQKICKLFISWMVYYKKKIWNIFCIQNTSGNTHKRHQHINFGKNTNNLIICNYTINQDTFFTNNKNSQF